VRKERKKDTLKTSRNYDSGSVTSWMTGGGIKLCEAAPSTRASFAACGVLTAGSVGDRLLEGAIVGGTADVCPVSDTELGRNGWGLCWWRGEGLLLMLLAAEFVLGDILPCCYRYISDERAT
jgi:hypothetical protein